MEDTDRNGDLKKVITAIINEFSKEEGGNRVTSNNMAGLHWKLMMALDGKVGFNPPQEAPEKPKQEMKNADDHNRPLYRHGGTQDS